ncbi:MAG: AMP-dependent synthetase/ligase [Actinomycetota bacterium]|nr:AMP-dependent synthetase/ligase [Actinomycetota bacterium]
MDSSWRSLADIAVEHARRTPQRVVVRRRTRSGWDDVTAAALLEELESVARGLVAAGVGPGDRVGLMASTRYEWTVVDLAVWAAGAVTVPVYETSSADQLAWILEDSGAVACLVETPGHARTLASVADRAPALRRTWTIEDGGMAALAAEGRVVEAGVLDERRAGLDAGALATIIYTSGTTGRPKGCELTHGNFLAECTSAVEALPELFEAEDAATLVFLPLAHVFGRMIQIAVLMKGLVLGHTDVGRLTKDLATFQPTFVLAVPRVFEKVYDGARRKAVAAGRGRVFGLASDTAIAYSRALERRGPGPLLRARRAVFDRLVYAKLRAALGGRVQWAVSGGAPLGERLGHFFRGAGVTVLEGYGLTETTAAACVNTRAAQRVGTVGRALPRFELRVAADGEVQVRGGHVFRGYWRNPEATAAVLTQDGWFRTGDLGTLDADGFLRITGRAKEILVLSSGKNVAPAPLEDAVRAHALVSQCVVVGDERPFAAALVTLDGEALAAWAAARGAGARPVDELPTHPDVLAEVQSAIDAANRTVSDAEAIKRFTVLRDDFTVESGHLTPSMKVRRAVVLEEFATDVDAMYSPRDGTRVAV